MRAHGEKVARNFAHTAWTVAACDAAPQRGLEYREKRSIIHIAEFNQGPLLWALFDFGTAKGWADAGVGLLFARIGELSLLILATWQPNEGDAPDCAMVVISRWCTTDTRGHNGLLASRSENQPVFNGLL